MANVFKRLHCHLWHMKKNFCKQSRNVWEIASKGPDFDFRCTFEGENNVSELFRGGKAANDSYKVVGLSDNAGNKSRVSAPFTCGGEQMLFSPQTSVSD